MIRSHRRAHFLLWLFLGVGIAGSATFFWLRQPADVTAPLPGPLTSVYGSKVSNPVALAKNAILPERRG